MINMDKKMENGRVGEGEWNQWLQECRERLCEIYFRYCESGREATRLENFMAFRGGQTYGEENEKIVEVEERKGKVVITTRQLSDYKYFLRYEVVEIGGQMKIRDNRKSSIDGVGWTGYRL